jgi:hypothetical protein
MLKRRLTLIFKVDNLLRMIRHRIMRNFNILERDRTQNRTPLFADRAPTIFRNDEIARQDMAESPQLLTMH